MGKGSKNRVKGNLRPASSTSAAEALSSAPSLSSSSSPSLSPAGAAAVFNPFEAAGAVYSTAGSPAPHRGQLLSSSTTSLAVSGTQLDANLVVLVRNLSKRAPTTKVRALDELNAYVDGNDDGALAGLAVVWPKLFNRLAGDTDRRVRQAAHAAHRNLTCRLGRRVAPMLREISGTWVSGRFDTHREVAKAATDSLAGVFPGGKLKDALAFCQAELLKYSRENALEKTAEMLST
ncbi:MAG: hypothetical protein BJ554DRAFT_3382 [Olpidium bornovanus]|uniref:E3 ubiquitin-protein ligase listerin n=1 Tax=Olpidium bornovanus TaxID=278681 RepID=A0A8H7ZP59_9FUNG|nr:MAG: hypothetical protein BJ554DRAFT_3382 [Olpidium bornovanus]